MQKPLRQPERFASAKAVVLLGFVFISLHTLNVTGSAQIRVSYDKFLDVTIAVTKTIDIPEQSGYALVDEKVVRVRPSRFDTFDVTFSLQANGRQPSKGDIKDVILTVNTMGQELVFSKMDAKLLGLIDDERQAFGAPIITGGKDSIMASIGKTYINEHSKFTISLPNFEKMINAKSVELRYGPYEFNLNGDRRARMKELYDFIQNMK